MEKNCHSSADSSRNRNQTDHFLKQLNKSSHKISKPHQQQQQHLNHQRSHASHHQHNNNNDNNNINISSNNNSNNQQLQQPPVYNINKNDFRDVVQKLTGSPAHDRLSTPPPIHPPKPPSSRLQRIRPPPLAHVSNRPPPTLLPPPINDARASSSGIFAGRPRSPFSPLPPFPTVSAAAESPISAYMRYLQSSFSISADAESRRIPGLSPPWNPNPYSLPQVQLPSPPPPFLLPTSPLAFGHIPSQYPLLSPSLLFSPSSQLGFPPLPPSPRFPVPSPRWNDP